MTGEQREAIERFDSACRKLADLRLSAMVKLEVNRHVSMPTDPSLDWFLEEVEILADESLVDRKKAAAGDLVRRLLPQLVSEVAPVVRDILGNHVVYLQGKVKAARAAADEAFGGNAQQSTMVRTPLEEKLHSAQTILARHGDRIMDSFSKSGELAAQLSDRFEIG